MNPDGGDANFFVKTVEYLRPALLIQVEEEFDND